MNISGDGSQCDFVFGTHDNLVLVLYVAADEEQERREIYGIL